MNIYKKLHEIQKKVKGLSKNNKSHNYEYVSGNKLLSFIKPLMDEHKLILKQEVLSIDNTRQDYDTKYSKKSEILSKVMMQFTWIDVETGEKDVNSFGANGQNDWEKGLGSALTYAERYFLLKYFHIATDEDDIDNPNRKKEENKNIKPKSREKLPLTEEGFEYLNSKGTKEDLLIALNERILDEEHRKTLTERLSNLQSNGNS